MTEGWFNNGEGLGKLQWRYLCYRYSGGERLTFDEWLVKYETIKLSEKDEAWLRENGMTFK